MSPTRSNRGFKREILGREVRLTFQKNVSCLLVLNILFYLEHANSHTYLYSCMEPSMNPAIV